MTHVLTFGAVKALPKPATPPVVPNELVIIGGSHDSNVEREAKAVRATGTRALVVAVGPASNPSPAAFARSLGLTGPRAEAIQRALLQSSWGEEKDLLVRLARVFSEVEQGKRVMKRLVITGHGDVNGARLLRLKQLALLAQAFPVAASRVEHLLVSSCHSGYATTVKQYRQIFTGLNSFAGYDRRAPSLERSAQQMTQWTNATRNGNLVGVNLEVARWTKTGGYRGTRSVSWEALVAQFEKQKSVLDEYRNGKKALPQAKADPRVIAIYDLLSQLAVHGDGDAGQRKRYELALSEIIRWRS